MVGSMTVSFVCLPSCPWTRDHSWSKVEPFVGRQITPTCRVSPSSVKLKSTPMEAHQMTVKSSSVIRSEQSDAGKSSLKEHDGVIIVDHGSRREQSNSMLHAFVDMYKEKTGHPIVEPAHMELAHPTIKEAFDLCVHQGAARVIISPYFLFPGRHWKQDIPSLAAEAAKEHPGVPYVVTAPLGLHELMVRYTAHRGGGDRRK